MVKTEAVGKRGGVCTFCACASLHVCCRLLPSRNHVFYRLHNNHQDLGKNLICLHGIGGRRIRVTPFCIGTGITDSFQSKIKFEDSCILFYWWEMKICNYCQPLNVGNFGLLVVTVHQLALCDCDKGLRQASYKEGRFVWAQGFLCWPLLSRLHSLEHAAAHTAGECAGQHVHLTARKGRGGGRVMSWSLWSPYILKMTPAPSSTSLTNKCLIY